MEPWRTPSAGVMDVDEALRLVDPKNRLQWIYVVAINAQAVPAAFVLLAMEFVGKIFHHGTGYEAIDSNTHLSPPTLHPVSQWDISGLCLLVS